VTGTKCTFQFDQAGYGWTESYYLSTTSTGFVVEQAAAQRLLVKRLALSGKQTSNTFTRLMDLSQKRVGELYRSTAGGTGNAAQDSDAPDTAALIRRYNALNNQSSAWFVRGIWDSAVILGGGFDPSSVWYSSLLQGFFNQLITDSWCWLGKDLLNTKRSQISTITADAQGHLTITSKLPIFPALSVNGQVQVQVSGAQGSDTANGTWVVTVLSTTSCQTVRQILINPYQLNSGFINYRPLNLIQIASCQLDRVVERKVGRPLYHSRGRSSKRRVTW
jgi:hypothetical protein